VFSPTDTIVAIATAPVRAGIGVVRISGPRAHAVARAILTVPHDLAPRHASLTHVRVPGTRSPRSPGSSTSASSIPDTQSPWSPGSSDPGLIDEVVATYFPAPHSYTTEDVVEISAHGSVVLLRDIVRAAIDAGARLAEPGEFTLRAFLNGRLDLVQAEAVADLVDAVTPLQARTAFDQLEGTLTRAIGELDRQLFDLAAQLEASVDFPDEGYHFVGPGEAAEALSHVRSGIDRLLATSATGRVIREGRTIAILGKPNVGKSSLFNHLVGTDRAIVAPGPGTTRDMLRESIDLEGIRLGVVDTAGIRESEDGVEQEGVVRARQAADVADLVVLVLDRSQPIEDIDLALLRKTASARRVVVVNKIDLPAAWTGGERAMASLDSGLEARDSRFSGSILPGAAVQRAEPHDPVLVSLKTGEGLRELRGAMRAAIEGEEPLRDAAIVTNVRHETLLRQARDAIQRAVENIEQAGGAASEELVLADIADGRRAFEEITGRRTTEDVLRRIFERFCIGK
jgi:tRNA modification GTPase